MIFIRLTQAIGVVLFVFGLWTAPSKHCLQPETIVGTFGAGWAGFWPSYLLALAGIVLVICGGIERIRRSRP